MHRSVVVAVAACALSAVGCSSANEPDIEPRSAHLRGDYIFLVRATQPEAEMDALIRGRLEADAAGCLRLDTSDRHTVIWPFGATLRAAGAQVSVVDRAGRVLATIADETQLAGGEVTELPSGVLASEARAAALTSCPGRYWIVAGS